MTRVSRLKLVLWAIAGLATAVAIARLLFGLGATTHLSDATPWGLWVGFDLSAVAMAAGGFVLTATVYIFRLERFHRIVRLGVLAAFLLYLSFVAVLVFELGLPWRIWHMIIYWNPHSPLFEVGWCVMLYTGVLALEFFPVPAERFSRLARVRAVLLRIRLPLVLLGIGLSTLHQSSLGSLFLIMPYRLHPLWYSPLLPVLFFVSAVALGLAMLIFESHAVAWLYGRKPETQLLERLAVASAWLFAAYLALRFGAIAARGELGLLVAHDRYAPLFWIEILLLAGLPALLFAIPRARRNAAVQWTVAALAVCGVVLNRVDVGGLAATNRVTALYVPSWMELAITAGIVSGAILAFCFFVERFRICDEQPTDPEAEATGSRPALNPVGLTWPGVPAVAHRNLYSMAFILAASGGFAMIAGIPETARGVPAVPVHRARGGDTLWIDGNLDGFGVAFHHADHVKREGDARSCVICHHANIPRDRNSPCADCHRDMYVPTDAFRHDWHASAGGAGIACSGCHPNGQVRTAATAKACASCHKDLLPAGSTIQVKAWQSAPAYTAAMHQLCVPCHMKKAGFENKPEMARCTWCHKESRDAIDARDVALQQRQKVGASVLLPTVMLANSGK